MKLLVPSLVAVLVIAVIMTPIVAESMGSFLTINKAKIKTEPQVEIDEAKIKTDGKIPTDGSGGAFGYGIITTGDSIMVTTTHAGVLDSEDQADALDPVWHNHYVRLGSDSNCGSDPAVVDITWESPGTIEIKNKKAVMEDLIAMFIGTHSITKAPLYMSPGTDVANVVSFELEPVFDDGGNLVAVCVTDIQPADEVEIKTKDD